MGRFFHSSHLPSPSRCSVVPASTVWTPADGSLRSGRMQALASRTRGLGSSLRSRPIRVGVASGLSSGFASHMSAPRSQPPNTQQHGLRKRACGPSHPVHQPACCTRTSAHHASQQPNRARRHELPMVFLPHVEGQARVRHANLRGGGGIMCCCQEVAFNPGSLRRCTVVVCDHCSTCRCEV